MIWEQNSVGIIMLNKCVERGMVSFSGKGERGEGGEGCGSVSYQMSTTAYSRRHH